LVFLLHSGLRRDGDAQPARQSGTAAASRPDPGSRFGFEPPGIDDMLDVLEFAVDGIELVINT